jgi:hypothetical protein
MIPTSTLTGTGPRSPTDGRARARARGLVLALAALACSPVVTRAAIQSVLLPGIDIRSVDFAVGAWCRYRVVDDAMGEADSTEVTIAIVGREKAAGASAYWLEIENRPVRGTDDQADYSRALVDERIRSMAPDDSLYRYVLKLYTKKGHGPVEPGDPRDLKGFAIVSPTSESDWKIIPHSGVSTELGDIDCESRSFTTEETRDIPAGHVTIRQHRSDRVQVWMSPKIPIFHLVKCEIERMRESQTVPPVRGIPPSGPRRSLTTSEIEASGSDARPHVVIP